MDNIAWRSTSLGNDSRGGSLVRTPCLRSSSRKKLVRLILAKAGDMDCLIYAGTGSLRLTFFLQDGSLRI